MNAFKLTLQQLENAAKIRKSGFVQAVLREAARDGDRIVVTPEQWARLTMKFLPPPGIHGPGDLFAVVAKPIARWIDATTARWVWLGIRTRLASCSACDRRRVVWNAAWQRFFAWFRGLLQRP